MTMKTGVSWQLKIKYDLQKDNKIFIFDMGQLLSSSESSGASSGT